jgi:hypothetical protein
MQRCRWGGDRCHGESLHRSNPVTSGTKVVLQRWHSSVEQPSSAARHLPRMPRGGRLPFQPIVSCDWVDGVQTNVSCHGSHRARTPMASSARSSLTIAALCCALQVSCRWYNDEWHIEAPPAEGEDGKLEEGRNVIFSRA